MAQNIANIPQKLIDAFNTRKLDEALAVISDQAVWMDVPNQVTFKGKEGYRQFDQGWLTAFPDGKIEITNVVASENSVVVEYTGRGTHTGPLLSPEGTIQPSGKTVELALCDVMQIKNGLITEARTYYDAATLLDQISENRRSVA